jgi:hypothetical protein
MQQKHALAWGFLKRTKFTKPVLQFCYGIVVANKLRHSFKRKIIFFELKPCMHNSIYTAFHIKLPFLELDYTGFNG